MNSITKPFSLYDENGKTLATRLYRTRIEQYRSRTMSQNDIIQAAFSYATATTEEQFNIKTVAVPRENDLANDLITNVLNEYNDTYTNIYVLNIARNTEYRERIKERLISNEYTEITPLVILSPTMTVNAYKKENRQIIITNMMSDQMWFAIGALYIVNNEELREAWITGDGEKINKYYDKTLKEIRENKLKQLIKDFSNLYKEGINKEDPRIESLESKRKTLKDYEDLITNLLMEIKKLEKDIIYDAYVQDDTKVKQFEKCLKRLFEKNTINNIKVEGQRVELNIKTPLLYINKNDYNVITNSPRSNWYTNLDTDWKTVLNKIFLTEEYKILFTNAIVLDMSRASINAKRVYEPEGTPNPHHYYFNCWGDYTNKIREAILNYEWEELMTYLVVATAGLNLLDSAVMNNFVRDITGNMSDKKILFKNNDKTTLYSMNDILKEVKINGETDILG